MASDHRLTVLETSSSRRVTAFVQGMGGCSKTVFKPAHKQSRRHATTPATLQLFKLQPELLEEGLTVLGNMRA